MKYERDTEVGHYTDIVVTTSSQLSFLPYRVGHLPFHDTSARLRPCFWVAGVVSDHPKFESKELFLRLREAKKNGK